MTTANRILQGVGLALIIISLAAVGYVVQISRVNTLSLHQPPSTTNISPKNSNGATHQVGSNTNGNSHTHIVQILFGDGKEGWNNRFFSPSRVITQQGDSVKWVNDDTVGHTVTAVRFNSGLIWPQGSSYGPSSYTRIFDKSGTFAYFCQIHPYMSGVVFTGVQETERVLNSTVGSTHYVDVKVEMPQGTAYTNSYGPYFIPTYAIVPVDARVTWTNKDYVAHTATAVDGSFDTQPVIPGSSITLAIDHLPGTISYYCKIHPWMQGTIDITPGPRSSTG
jgi:plastocyanin